MSPLVAVLLLLVILVAVYDWFWAPARSATTGGGETCARELVAAWALGVAADSANRSIAPGKKSKQFLTRLDNLKGRGRFCDPVVQEETTHLAGVDPVTESSWDTYRPCRRFDEGVSSTRSFDLKVIDPNTPRAAALLFERHAPRRWYDCRPKTLAYVGKSPVQWDGTVRRVSPDEALNCRAELIIWDRRKAGSSPIIPDAFVPRYPIILSPDVVAVTPVQLAQIGGLTLNSPLSPQLVNRAAHTLGAVLVKRGVSLPRPDSVRRPRTRMYKLTKELVSYVPRHEHGWLGDDTRGALTAAINAVSPKRVLEMGTWYGKSTVLIRTLAPDASIYAVDIFKPPPAIRHRLTRYTPGDKMFFAHPRLETFGANIMAVPGTGDIHAVQGEAVASVRLLAKMGRKFDLIYIDFEKKTERLVKVLEELRSLFPAAVLVGDDRVFPSVVRAVRVFAAAHPDVGVDELGGAYVVRPPGVAKFSAPPVPGQSESTGPYDGRAMTKWDKRIAPSTFT